MHTLVTVARMLARGGSRADRRHRHLMTTGVALATVFLLAAVNLLTIRTGGVYGGRLGGAFGLVTQPGLRPGTALALALLILPALAFLHQAGRIAQATRERRLAALRLAGATPQDVRRLNAIEAAQVSGTGATLGGIAFTVAERAALSIVGVHRTELFTLRIPLAVIAVITVIGVGTAVGLLADRHVVTSPLGVVRRARRAPSRGSIWSIPLAVGGPAVAFGLYEMEYLHWGIGGIFYVGGAIALVAGLALSAEWLAARTARLVARRARSAETLLAARGLEADPRAWGRTLAVVGLVVLFGTGAGWVEAEVLVSRYTETQILPDGTEVSGGIESFWLVSFALVDVALLFALTVAAAALIVQRAEFLMDERRSLAALAATGVPLHTLRKVARRQAILATTPICVVAALAGLIALAHPVGLEPGFTALWVVGRAVLMVALAVGAALLAISTTWLLLRRAASPTRLRTE